MIQIINTGVANIRSLQAAFDRLGQAWKLTENPTEIAEASHLVLPGVGAFAAAAEALDRLKLRDILRRRIDASQQATLCICLGMQLLFESSEESPTALGLGIIPATIKRFPVDVPVPQLGWNEVNVTRRDRSGWTPYPAGEAYFANSFRLIDPPPSDWGFASSDYGGPFLSSVWRDRTLACQFHPELSGPWGRVVLENWLAGQNSPSDASAPSSDKGQEPC